jgi:hypothetical protein
MQYFVLILIAIAAVAGFLNFPHPYNPWSLLGLLGGMLLSLSTVHLIFKKIKPLMATAITSFFSVALFYWLASIL